jgi:ABC-type glycerol-3-phosphate transport system permease component
MTIAMAFPIVTGKTVFPKWAVVFNPLIAKVLIPFIAIFLPNTKIVNALNMADMGLGSLITFVGLLILLMKKQKCK